MSDESLGGGSSDYDFLGEMEKTIEFKGDITDFEWDLRNRQWEEQRDKLVGQMLQNNLWNMLTPRHRHSHGDGMDTRSSHQSQAKSASLASTYSTVAWGGGNKPKSRSPSARNRLAMKSVSASALSNISRIVWKVPKMSELELFKYLDDWDKSSYGKRDRLIMEFIHAYDTKDHVYDTDFAFSNGASLIFARFVVGLHICFLKHRRVWHYYDACGIFVRSLQSDRFTEEFLRLGGLSYIIQVVRVDESIETDKLRACHFLLNMMKGRNGHAVKQFMCDTPHLLESLVDSLTMCKNKELIKTCGQIFENLCIEIPPANVGMVGGYLMHALPCDFNPMLQAMAFRVLQNFVRMKPSLSTKIVKPILDNLKTADSELLISMSNLGVIILQTKYGSEMVSTLMSAAEGIHLREVFKTVFHSHSQSTRGMSTREVTDDMKRVREKREKVRLKQLRYDQYMHQAGALFVLNQMMTHRVESVNDFVSKGIFGLSLKTLGSCPHWEVQGQGVTMVKFLFSVSMDCALSYYMMLPPRMLLLIMTKPAECLRYFTSPICVYLRKLGRFALRYWSEWVEKVVVVARLYAKGSKIPPEVFQLTQMSRKVYEIQQAIADLLDEPVMEAAPKTPEENSEAEQEDHQDFLESSDDEKMGEYRDGQHVIMGDDRFEPFRTFLEDDDDFVISEDKLDIRIEPDQAIVFESLLSENDDDEKELAAYKTAMLADVKKRSGFGPDFAGELLGEDAAAPGEEEDEGGEAGDEGNAEEEMVEMDEEEPEEP